MDAAELGAGEAGAKLVDGRGALWVPTLEAKKRTRATKPKTK